MRSAAPWITLLARGGYVAKGLVYVVMGFLAARAAMGSGGSTEDTRGVLRIIGDGPLGTMALVAIGAGLLCYALWRLVSAATDAERRGDNPSSLAIRLGHALRGVAYGALGLQTLRHLGGPEASNSEQAQDWTARLLGMPGGRWLVIAVGLGFIGYACYQLYRASTDKVIAHLDLHEAGADAARWIERLGRFGVAARAVVFAMIGVLLVRAGWRYAPSQAGGIEESLDALARGPNGALVLGTVAVGLVAYGVYQLATARYREMRVA